MSCIDMSEDAKDPQGTTTGRKALPENEDMPQSCIMAANFVAGFAQGRKVVLNPGRRRLKGGEAAVCVATSQAALDEALTRSFSRALHPASGTLSPDLAQGPATVNPLDWIKIEPVLHTSSP